MSVIAGKSQTRGSSCNLPKEILDYGKAGKQTAGQRTRLTLGSFACLDYRVQGDGPVGSRPEPFPMSRVAVRRGTGRHSRYKRRTATVIQPVPPFAICAGDLSATLLNVLLWNKL